MADTVVIQAKTTRKQEFKIVPQLDRYPKLVALGQTAFGKLALVGAFATCLKLIQFEFWMEMALVIAILSYFPSRRRMLVSLATFYWLLFHSGWLNWTFLRSLAKESGLGPDWQITVFISALMAALFCVIAGYFHYVLSERVTIFARRPVFCLVACEALLMGTASVLPASGKAHAIAWSIVAVSAPFLWYFAYALKDATTKTPDGAWLQYGTVRPFWGPNTVPHAKGAAYLRKTEARTPEDLCVVQLKAVKLLIWVFFLRLALRAIVVIGYDGVTNGGPFGPIAQVLHLNSVSLGIPELRVALLQPALPVSVAWASVLLNFGEEFLTLTIAGHIITACCWMAGFNILRNTYKPLRSRTLSEFWNRFYYYFKELLVEFFFFPTFTRYFKRHRRIRMFAATIAAATFGNMIYHFLRDYRYVAEMGLWKALGGFQTYTFYAIVLGVGIGISQLRAQGRMRLCGDAPWWRKSLATTGVLLFFCLIQVFDQEGRSLSLRECLRFFLHLFSISA